MAPIIEAKNPADWSGPYHPTARPIHSASKAPPMPISVVMMKPPGSRPGVRNLAIRPTMKPMMILTRKCIISYGFNFLRLKLAPAIAAYSRAIPVAVREVTACLCRRESAFYEGGLLRLIGFFPDLAAGFFCLLSGHLPPRERRFDALM